MEGQLRGKCTLFWVTRRAASVIAAICEGSETNCKSFLMTNLRGRDYPPKKNWSRERLNSLQRIPQDSHHLSSVFFFVPHWILITNQVRFTNPGTPRVPSLFFPGTVGLENPNHAKIMRKIAGRSILRELLIWSQTNKQEIMILINKHKTFPALAGELRTLRNERITTNQTPESPEVPCHPPSSLWCAHRSHSDQSDGQGNKRGGGVGGVAKVGSQLHGGILLRK